MKKYADVRQSPAYMLWLASNAWQRAMRKALEPWNLTHVQFAVLSCLEREASDTVCITQVEVARWIDIDENMNSQVMRSLEQRALIERREHPSDRRAHRLVITQEGREIALAARAVVIEIKEQFFSSLSESQQQDLVGFLQQLVECANSQELDS